MVKNSRDCNFISTDKRSFIINSLLRHLYAIKKFKLQKMKGGNTMRRQKSSEGQLTFLGQPGILLLTIFFCVVLLALPEQTDAQPQLGWIPFDESSPAELASRSYMKDETTTGLLVNFDVSGMYVHNVGIEGVVYQRLSIPGKATSTTIENRRSL